MAEEKSDSPIPLDYSTPEKRKMSRWVRWMLVVLTGFLGFVVILAFLPDHAISRANADKAICHSHLHQIGMAIVAYSNNHGGEFPDSFQTILLNEEVRPEAFVCPRTNDIAVPVSTTQEMAADLIKPGHVSYLYLGKGLTDKTVLPNQVIAYEPLANHGDGIDILLGDGSATFVDATRATKIISDANAGKRPVMLPP